MAEAARKESTLRFSLPPPGEGAKSGPGPGEKRKSVKHSRLSVLLSRAMSYDEKRRSFEVKKRGFLEPFEADLKIDPDKSELEFQYLLISMEDTAIGDAKHLQAPAEMPLSTRVLWGLERALRRARDFLRGGATYRLMRCVNRVLASTRDMLLQQQLQSLTLQLHALPDAKSVKELPRGMASPRTTTHAPDRLRHFDRLRAAQDFAHYLPPAQPSEPDQSDPVAVTSGLSRTLSSTTGLRPAAAPVAGRPGTGGGKASHSLTLGRGLAWRTVWPDLPTEPSTPSRCPAVASTLPKPGTGSRSGPVADLAQSTRLFGRDGHVRESQAAGEAAAAEGASDVFAATRPQGAPARRDGGPKVQDPLIDAFPMPRLQGLTSGFAAKEPTPACPWVTMPPKGGWPKAEVLCRSLSSHPALSRQRSGADLGSAEAAPRDDEARQAPEAVPGGGRPADAGLLPPVRSCQEVLEDALGLTLKPAKLPAAAPVGQAEAGAAPAAQGGQRSSTAPGRAYKARNSRGRMRLKGASQQDALSRPATGTSTQSVSKSSVLESQVGSMTVRLLELRGLERSRGSTAGGGLRAEQYGASLACLARANSAPGLSKSHCLPMPGCGPLEADAGAFPVLERCCLPEVGYIQGCGREGLLPRLGVKFFAGRSSKLILDSMLISDADLQAMLEALQTPFCGPGQQQQNGPGDRVGRPVEILEVSLSNNRRLSDGAVARFLRTALQGSALVSRPCVGPLKVLSLASCVGLGAGTVETLGNLLRRKSELAQLEELDLSGVCVPTLCWEAFVNGLSASTSLRVLRLARTGCGRGSQRACVLVAKLIIVCRTLEVVDVSGNHFLHEGCRAMAENLQQASKRLQELDLSHNAGFTSPDKVEMEAAGVGEGQSSPPMPALSLNPVIHVLSVLGETTVKRVAFANCRLSFEEDSVLEDVVQSSEIVHLDVSDNPHGELGLRCLVRLLARCCGQGQELQRLDLGTVRDSSAAAGTLVYDYVDPSALYRLTLGSPHHRSVLRLLLKRGEEATGGDRKEDFTCFSGEQLDGRSASMQALCWKRLDRGGDDWQVPETGILTFQFRLPPFFAPLDDAQTVVRKFARTMTVRVSFGAFARIRQLVASVQEARSQQLLYSAMSKDLSFKLCQVKDLANMLPDHYVFIVATLLPAVQEHTTRKALFDLLDSCRGKGAKKQMVRLKTDTRNLLYFNYRHPDGRYSLNLANKADRGTARRCIVMSNWMKHHSLARGLVDCSEFGNRECLRSTAIDNERFAFESTEWQLPDGGTLSFDFVLPRQALEPENAMQESSLLLLAQTLEHSSCNFRDKLSALRLIAHLLVLLPEQLQVLIEVFPEWHNLYELGGKSYRSRQPRAEAFIILYNRTLYHSEVVSAKLLYNSNVLHRSETEAIRQRLGWIHTFDLVSCHQPHSNMGNRHGPMNMVAFDGWTIVKLLLAISLGERYPNFEDNLWSEKRDLYERGYPFIIPSAWVPDPPRVGEFTTTFVSKAEEVNLTKRRDLATEFLGWTFRPGRKSDENR